MRLIHGCNVMTGPGFLGVFKDERMLGKLQLDPRDAKQWEVLPMAAWNEDEKGQPELRRNGRGRAHDANMSRTTSVDIGVRRLVALDSSLDDYSKTINEGGA